MSALVGIDFGGHVCKVSCTIQFGLSPDQEPLATRGDTFLFNTNLEVQGVNLNPFMHWEGGTSDDDTSMSDNSSRLGLPGKGIELITDPQNTSEYGVKVHLDSGRDCLFLSREMTITMLFRKIFNIVNGNIAAKYPTQGIKTFQAVITSSTHLTTKQQKCFLQAASHAGFDSVGALSHELAISLVHGPKVGKYLLCIDVGYSSTTSTILKPTPSTSNFICEWHAPHGGRDIDLILAQHFEQEISPLHGHRIRDDPGACTLLLEVCRKAKEALTSASGVPFDYRYGPMGIEYHTILTWQTFRSLLEPFLDQIHLLIHKTLDSASLTKSDIDTVIFSGLSLTFFKTDLSFVFDKATLVNAGSRAMSQGALIACARLPDSPGSHWISRASQEVSVDWLPFAQVSSPDPLVDNLLSMLEGLMTSDETDPSNRGRKSKPKAAVLRSIAGDEDVIRSINDKLAKLEVNIQADISAAEAAPDTHPGKGDYLNNLCAHYLSKYQLTGVIFDLNNAIIWSAKALSLVDKKKEPRHEYLANLASCLTKHYEHSGDMSVLSRAIHDQGCVVEGVPDDHPRKASFLSNYGALLLSRGEHLGHLPDVEEGARHLQQAINIARDEDVEVLVNALSNLGNSLHLIYNWTGKVEDLYRMIKCYETALELTEEKGATRASMLNSCGCAMMMHCRHFEDTEDARRAILYFEEALRHIPERHPSRHLYLSNYVGALQATFRFSNDFSIVNHAMELQQEVLELTPDAHPGKSLRVNRMGSLLIDRFSITEDPDDIERAIKHHQSALALAREDQLHVRFLVLGSLSTALTIRFEAVGSTGDLEESIRLAEEAIELVDEGSDRAKALFNLASRYLTHYHSLREPVSLEKSIRINKEVVQSSAPLSVRFQAARNWSSGTLYSTNGPAAQEAVIAMVDLLSQLAWPGLSLASQIHVLQTAAQTACDAAAIALHFKDVQSALEWLEQGRTIVWNQLLQVRSPLSDLKEKEPELADRMLKLSQKLYMGIGGDIEDQDLEMDHTIRLRVSKSAEFARNMIALERDKLLQEARAIPGFENLMKEKNYKDFAVASHDGPVVVINVSQHRCDAIIITAKSIPFTLPLGNFSYAQAKDLQEKLFGTLKDSGILRRGTESNEEHSTDSTERFGRPRKKPVDQDAVDATFRYILKELWDNVVEPILNAIGVGVELDEDMPHFWWCPTGPLTFLPLHAAGVYAADGDTETPRISLLDYVVSSYIPSLSALHDIMYNRPQPPPAAVDRKVDMLAIVQPDTPGQSPLPGTLRELEVIRKYKGFLDGDLGFASDSHGSLHVLQSDQATRKSVLSGLQNTLGTGSARWLHLACHGSQDDKSPTESAFHLYDGPLSLLTLSTLPFANPGIDNDFAFLSACSTASGATAHADEAVHLAAGMLISGGYRSVVASLWAINDGDAVGVADDVYEFLLRKSKPKEWPFGRPTRIVAQSETGRICLVEEYEEEGENEARVMPDSRKAARALHQAVRNLRAKHAGRHGGTKFTSWVPYIHVGM